MAALPPFEDVEPEGQGLFVRDGEFVHVEQRPGYGGGEVIRIPEAIYISFSKTNISTEQAMSKEGFIPDVYAGMDGFDGVAAADDDLLAVRQLQVEPSFLHTPHGLQGDVLPVAVLCSTGDGANSIHNHV